MLVCQIRRLQTVQSHNDSEFQTMQKHVAWLAALQLPFSLPEFCRLCDAYCFSSLSSYRGLHSREVSSAFVANSIAEADPESVAKNRSSKFGIRLGKFPVPIKI